MDRQSSSGEIFLGLDVGANSVGWAVVSVNGEDANSGRIVGVGSRVFDAGVEGQLEQGKEESRNKKRRDARSHRKILARRAKRKKGLWSLLERSGLIPEGDPLNTIPSLDRHFSETYAERLGLSTGEDKKGKRRLMHIIPYFLRARALDERLEPHELGRVLYHLAQRRGFKSNRKAAPKEKEKKKEEEGMKAEIAGLERDIAESGSRTLGEYFSRLDPEQERIRNRHTSREMYEEEFEAIWSAQKPHYPDILTDEFKEQVHYAIFYQRPLRISKEFIGNCALEEDRKRAPWALLSSQRFRLIQNVNNLEFYDFSTGEILKFTPETAPDERKALIDELEIKGDLTFSRVRKILNLPKEGKFNLEEGGEKKLIGNRTAATLAKIFGEKRWKEFSDEEREQIVEDVRSIEDEEALARRGKRKWGLDEEAAEKFGRLELEDGYCRLSRQAIAKLIPLMEGGKRYMEAVKEVYPHRATPKPLDFLPPVVEVFPDLRNPVVVRALTELRKVVNGVIRRYGKPDAIRVELARERKRNKKERQAIWRQQRRNEEARQEAFKKILENTSITQPKRRDIEKVLLADECGWHCPYTGKSIGWNALLGPHPQFDIEHIIPFSRCLDNSFYNKTLCDVEENRSVKGGKTPYEAYSGNPEKWNEILQRVRNFRGDAKNAKLERFQLHGKALEKLLSDFENRKLTDTAYASRLAVEYLGLLYGADQTGVVSGKKVVQAGRGQVTGYLRNEWGLNGILNDGGEKTRDDHRHHAVDAVCIALTTPKTVKMLSDAARRAEAKGRRLFEDVPPPWPGFLDEVRRHIDEMVVSHRVGKKVRGALHEETIYSPPIPGKDPSIRHVRKPLEDLSKSEVNSIVDPAVKQLVLDKLKELGSDDPKKVFANKENHPYLTTKDGRRIPIHKVRIEKKISTFTVGEGVRQRHVTTKSNHHIEVVAVLDKEGKTKKWEGHLVDLKQARDRLRAGQPVVKRDHGEGKRFVFSLAGGETIEIDEPGGGRGLYVVRTISFVRQGGREYPGIAFVCINDARKKKDILSAGDWKTSLIEPLRRLNCRKVLITPLGEVHRAND